MRVLVLGGDGYLGWPTVMSLAAQGHEVWAVDNYLRRRMASETDSEPLIPTPDLPSRAAAFQAGGGTAIHVEIGDCADFDFLSGLFEAVRPEAVIHYAEQPSAPYSMKGFDEARLTLRNNLDTTFNVIWAVMRHAPDCHIIKLGTMGEYGTPNIDIEEGWIDINHKGRQDRFLYPRAAGSLYHTTKVLDTDLLWFYVRTYGLAVTDLMQGPVYGIETDETGADEAILPNFHYDDIFGTVVNRFLVQAVAGLPLTVYGKGGQTRGYLNLRDTLQCVSLAMANPAGAGELRILNQFTEVFSVTQLAERVREAGAAIGLDVAVQEVPNPRKELEEHYYNPAHSGLLELGLKPHPMTTDILVDMLHVVQRHAEAIDPARVLPRVRWRK
jgi:UDP-sulfoquinovose synthase